MNMDYYHAMIHCELNPTECCWVQAKCYTRANSNNIIGGLRKKLMFLMFLIVFLLKILRSMHFCEVRGFMFGYCKEFLQAKHIKRCKKIVQVTSTN